MLLIVNFFLLITLKIATRTPFSNKVVVYPVSQNKALSSKDSIVVDFITDGSLPLSFGYYDNNYDYQFIRLIKGNEEKERIVLHNTQQSIFYNVNKINCPYIFHAGDKILISIKNKELKVLCLNNTYRNDELTFFPTLLKNRKTLSLGSLPKEKQTLIKNAKHYSLTTDSILKQDFTASLTQLKEFKIQYNIGEKYIADAASLLKFTYLINMLSPVIEKPAKPLLYDKYFLNALQTYNNDFKDSVNLSNYTFRFALYQYNKFLCRDFLNGKNVFEKQFQSALKNFRDEACRNYLLYELMRTAYIKDKVVFINYLPAFKKECSNLQYKNYISELNAKNNSPINESTIEKLSGETTTFQSIIREQPSKFILIDFWASWCLPCVEGLNHFETIKERYKNKPVSFVFISLDNSKDSWIKYTNKYNNLMNQSNCYLLTNNFSSPVCKKYNIQTIPRYMVINANGEVLSLNVYNNNDKILFQLIDKIIETHK